MQNCFQNLCIAPKNLIKQLLSCRRSTQNALHKIIVVVFRTLIRIFTRVASWNIIFIKLIKLLILGLVRVYQVYFSPTRYPNQVHWV